MPQVVAGVCQASRLVGQTPRASPRGEDSPLPMVRGSSLSNGIDEVLWCIGLRSLSRKPLLMLSSRLGSQIARLCRPFPGGSLSLGPPMAPSAKTVALQIVSCSPSQASAQPTSILARAVFAAVSNQVLPMCMPVAGHCAGQHNAWCCTQPW